MQVFTQNANRTGGIRGLVYISLRCSLVLDFGYYMDTEGIDSFVPSHYAKLSMVSCILIVHLVFFTTGSTHLGRNGKLQLPFGLNYFLTSNYNEFSIITRS